MKRVEKLNTFEHIVVSKCLIEVSDVLIISSQCIAK